MEMEQKISGAVRQKSREKTSGSESQAIYKGLLSQEKLVVVSLEALIRAGK
jgi:hypothetical protein